MLTYALIALIICSSVSSGTPCLPMHIEFCENAGYNSTFLPNFLGMTDIQEVKYKLETYIPLVKFGCSSRLKFFLCSLHLPKCYGTHGSIGPCRTLCEHVARRCSPVLKEFGLSWTFNCSALPIVRSSKNPCMEGPKEKFPFLRSNIFPSKTKIHPRCIHLMRTHLYVYSSARDACDPLCNTHILLSKEDKSYMTIWIAMWSISTFCVGLCLMVTLIFDASLFPYPERPILYMILSYTFIAAGYLIRLEAGSSYVACANDEASGLMIWVREGVLTTPCVVVFLFLYYFSLAAGTWWLIHSICWFLHIWKGCSQESLRMKSSALHTLGWVTPAVLCITCLALRKVEADEITGVCFAGGEDPISYFRWVIAPQFLFVTIGGSFVLVSYSVLWRLRASSDPDRWSYIRPEVIAVRMGISCLLYMIPATCVLAISFYELHNRENWRRQHHSNPSVEVYMLKIFMTMSPGLFLSLFIVDNKVIGTWKAVWNRIKKGRNREDVNHKPVCLHRIKNKGQDDLVKNF